MTRRLGRAAGILILLSAALVATACSAPADETSTEPSQSATTEAEPSATPACPDHVPGVHDGSRDDPYLIGDEISIGCFTVVVDEVQANATDAVIATNPDAAPAEGNVYMTATLTITRASDGPGDVSDLEVVLGGSTTTNGDPADGLAVDPPTPSGELEEGQSVTGTYVFEMSGGASASVELRIGSMDPISVLTY